MKSQELRIGNWVQYSLCDGELVEGQVNEINERWATVNKWHVDKPIPLTEEWLVKFGLEKRGNEWHHTDKDQYPYIFIYFEHDHFLNGNIIGLMRSTKVQERSVISNDLKHVHQLQNLYFALTGEELEIKKRC